MIHIEKDVNNPPPQLQLKFKNKKEKALGQHIRNLLDARDGSTALGRIYRGAKPKLLALYHKKCAYCESDLQHVTSALVVEHYRPKDGILGEPKKRGYYWLAYEWSNLVLACSDCNNKKSNRFPIRGARVTKPSKTSGFRWLAHGKILRSELPLLFHPEVDKPEVAFRFTPNGKVKGIDIAERAKRSIKICGLNRAGLVVMRRKCLASFTNRFRDVIHALIKTQEAAPLAKADFLNCLDETFTPIFQDLKTGGAPSQAYSSLVCQSLARFEEFFLKQLEGEPRKILDKAFRRFQNSSD